MTIREVQEAWEAQYLSPYAALSQNTKGRREPEALCDIRPGSDFALQGVSQIKAQDAGVFGAGGGPLPDPADPYPGGGSDCPDYSSCITDE